MGAWWCYMSPTSAANGEYNTTSLRLCHGRRPSYGKRLAMEGGVELSHVLLLTCRPVHLIIRTTLTSRYWCNMQ